MKYKIIYHVGEKVKLSTKADSGFLFIEDNKIYIFGNNGNKIDFDKITNINMFKSNGLGTILKVELVDKIIFLSVVRICIGGIFAIENFRKAVSFLII